MNTSDTPAQAWQTSLLAAPQLQQLSTLRDPAIDEPSDGQRHAPDTSLWHVDAPVAVLHFAYNRCSVWCCPQCRCSVVQYTETGGLLRGPQAAGD